MEGEPFRRWFVSLGSGFDVESTAGRSGWGAPIARGSAPDRELAHD